MKNLMGHSLKMAVRKMSKHFADIIFNYRLVVFT
jgi:hypothetical protein